MAQKSRYEKRLESFAEHLAIPFHALSYLFFTCIQALKAGYNQAKAESLPLPTTPNEPTE